MLNNPHSFSSDPDFKPLTSRKSDYLNAAEFDITAMIDLVFMMNIFFMVTSITSALADIDLPLARNVVAADRETSYIIAILADPDSAESLVYLGGDDSGEPLRDPKSHQQEIQDAVAAGVTGHERSVIIRAEKNIKLRELMYVAKAARAVEGVTIKFAVTEIE